MPTTPASLLLAEPHYRATDGRPPWEAVLRFLRDRAALVQAGALSAGAAVCPAGARVVAVGASLPDIARTAGAVGAVAGVDMAPFDAALGASRATGRWLTRAVGCQCGRYEEVTGRLAVVGGSGGLAGLADFAALGCGPLPRRLSGQAVLPGAGDTTAAIDALVFWVEYAAADAPAGAGVRGDSCSASFTPAWSSGAPGPAATTQATQAVFLLPAPVVAVPSPGGLAIALHLDIEARDELGSELAVRADVEVG
jgi:hypothetical protein